MRIIEEGNIINEMYKNPQKYDYEESTECWICENNIFGDDNNSQVRDHCHLTGKYLGAAHSFCHLRLSLKPNKTIIPVVFPNNLRGYDSHLIMQAMSRVKGNLKCIPNNIYRAKAIIR